ncbi:hypothetical protein [Allorhizobium undicola]|uniref:hypothetical protein n=1 Tax=Allorhizobium undicola TaxID=78527 RepID=UPI00048124A3|nr:hypothetical protein [Allorhizobium undicola]
MLISDNASARIHASIRPTETVSAPLAGDGGRGNQRQPRKRAREAALQTAGPEMGGPLPDEPESADAAWLMASAIFELAAGHQEDEGQAAAEEKPADANADAAAGEGGEEGDVADLLHFLDPHDGDAG